MQICCSLKAHLHWQHLGGRKPTHLTSGNICIRQQQKPSAKYHEARNTDVSRKNTDVSRVSFHPLATFVGNNGRGSDT